MVWLDGAPASGLAIEKLDEQALLREREFGELEVQHVFDVIFPNADGKLAHAEDGKRDMRLRRGRDGEAVAQDADIAVGEGDGLRGEDDAGPRDHAQEPVLEAREPEAVRHVDRREQADPEQRHVHKGEIGDDVKQLLIGECLLSGQRRGKPGDMEQEQHDERKRGALVQRQLLDARGFVGDAEAAGLRTDERANGRDGGHGCEERVVKFRPERGARAEHEPRKKHRVAEREREAEEDDFREADPHDAESANEEEQRDDEADEARETAEVVDDRRAVKEALPPGQAGDVERICGSPHRLERALRPPRSLLEKLARCVRGEARGERFVQIVELVAGGLELDGRGPVLGDRLGRDAAYRLDGRAAHDEARAVADDRVPCVARGLEGAKKEPLFVLQDALQTEIPRDGVAVVKILRRLDHRHFGVAEKTDGAVEKVARRDEVGVEGHDQFTVAAPESGVHVAGLGVEIVWAVEIFAAQFLGERAHGGAALVVEQPDFHARILHRLAADDRALEHLDGLGVGRQPHIDPRQVFAGAHGALGVVGLRGAVGHAQLREIGEGDAAVDDEFAQQKQHAHDCVRRVVQTERGHEAEEEIADLQHEEKDRDGRANPVRRLLEKQQQRRSEGEDENRREKNPGQRRVVVNGRKMQAHPASKVHSLHQPVAPLQVICAPHSPDDENQEQIKAIPAGRQQAIVPRCRDWRLASHGLGAKRRRCARSRRTGLR